MSLILHIDTSTTSCSVALSNKGSLLHSIAYDNGYSHAENLHPFIKRLLEESKLETKDLAAVAISKGPGSYTGLRIGVSAAKGLSFALKIPLIGIDTLQTMAVAAKELNPQASYYCAMIDARRMEVYTNVYDIQLQAQTQTSALILSDLSIKQFEIYSSICFFGNGYNKAHALLSTIQSAVFINNIVPEAKYMIGLAYEKFLNQDFEDLIYFEPFYLKDFLILKKTS